MEKDEIKEEFAVREEQLKIHSALINEEIGLMSRILQIRQQLRAMGIEAPYSRKIEENIAAVNGNALPKRRGRPPGSKNRQKGEEADEKKSMPLYALLENISLLAAKPLSHAEYVEAAIQSGYQSKAADFSNMVYQSLLKLVKGGSFTKSEDGKFFILVNEAQPAVEEKPIEEVPVLPNENGIPIEN